MANRINFDTAFVEYQSVHIDNDWELEGLREMMSEYIKRGFKLKVDFSGSKKRSVQNPSKNVHWMYANIEQREPSDKSEESCPFSFNKNKK